MLSQAGLASPQGYEYAQSLLRDRQHELQALEMRHRLKQMPPDEYASCRRSLLHAISELSRIERDYPECNPPSLRTETEEALIK